MKKLFLAITIALAISPQLHAIVYSDKTFMMPRSIHSYLPMHYTTFHRLIKQGSSDENAWGGHLQAVAFYNGANNRDGIGTYFGTGNKSEVTFGVSGQDVDARFIIHHSGYYYYHDEALTQHYFIYAVGQSLYKYTPATNDIETTLKGTLKLNPQYSRYGVLLDYYHDLDSISNNLFFTINIPLVCVSTDMGASAYNETKDSVSGKGLLDYFSGCYSQEGNDWLANLQSPLTHAKIDGPHSDTGIADVKIGVGYKFVEQENYELKGKLHVIVPTSSAPNGKSLFEPVVGNGDHWGVGAGFDGSLNVKRSQEDSLEFLYNLEYTFLFKGDETRTLGFRHGLDYLPLKSAEDTPVILPWYYYLLGGQSGRKGVFPLANVLTRPLSVLPAGHISGYAAFAYHRNNVTLDFGYSFFAREGEKITVKSWKNNEYGLASAAYVTLNDFNPTLDSLVAENGTLYQGEQEATDAPMPERGRGEWIQCNELNPNTPATPAVLVHALHGAIGYTLSERANPVMIGCGFSVDWNQDNAEPRGYMLWAKAGMAF